MRGAKAAVLLPAEVVERHSVCTRGSSVERSALTSRAEEADRGEMRLERAGR